MKALIPFRSVLCFGFLFFGISSLWSQTKDSTGTTMERESVFDEAQAMKNNLPPRRPEPVNPTVWVTKLNPVLLVRGELPVYIERKLGKSFSAEAAAGITFQDYFKQVIIQGKPLFQKDPNEDKLSGLTAKLALRYYPFHTALSELYISPEISVKNYRKDVHGVYMNSDGKYTDGKLRDQQKYMDIKALMGFQTADEYGSEFYIDWYIGAGLRIGDEENVVPDESNANVIKLKQVNVLSPIVTLGVKLGLGL